MQWPTKKTLLCYEVIYCNPRALNTEIISNNVLKYTGVIDTEWMGQFVQTLKKVK